MARSTAPPLEVLVRILTDRDSLVAVTLADPLYFLYQALEIISVRAVTLLKRRSWL